MNDFSNRLLVLGSFLELFAIASAVYSQSKAKKNEKTDNGNLVSGPNAKVVGPAAVNVGSKVRSLSAKGLHPFHASQSRMKNYRHQFLRRTEEHIVRHAMGK